MGRKEGSRRVGFVRVFRQTAFALVVSAAFASATGVAGEKLDMLFIQGGTGVNPEG